MVTGRYGQPAETEAEWRLRLEDEARRKAEFEKSIQYQNQTPEQQALIRKRCELTQPSQLFMDAPETKMTSKDTTGTLP